MNIIEIEIASLIPDPANARRHGQKNLDAIKGSLARFGQQKPLVITTENVVIAGNGTLEAAKFLGWKTIQCVRTDLKGSQLTAYGLADNRSSDLGEYDTGALSALLDSLQKEDFDLSEIGFDHDDLKLIFEDNDGGLNEEENKYSVKIDPPVYIPRGDKPEYEDIYNTEKMESLIDRIDKSNIDDKTKVFLRHAAERHVVFNFEMIAEFYAHASKDVQILMEESALVVIDFKKAIEDGFVRMTKDLADLAHE